MNKNMRIVSIVKLENLLAQVIQMTNYTDKWDVCGAHRRFFNLQNVPSTKKKKEREKKTKIRKEKANRRTYWIYVWHVLCMYNPKFTNKEKNEENGQVMLDLSAFNIYLFVVQIY